MTSCQKNKNKKEKNKRYKNYYFKLGVIPRSLLRQFEIRNCWSRSEKFRGKYSVACCKDFKNEVLDSAQELQIPDIAKF